MRISLIGYGKMGKTIEQIALERGHEISHKIDINNASDLAQITAKTTDVAIEFTTPKNAVSNLKHCLRNGVPVVSGTTGWLEQKPEIEALTEAQHGAFFYASNFSIGVNIFFRINEMLAQMMENYSDYEAKITEIHHTEKKDAPSGTAITLAQGILKNLTRKTNWKLAPSEVEDALEITALREPNVPGTHEINYTSEIDTIELKHTAHSRKGFALGAVLAAEWLPNQKGSLGMTDLLGW